MKYYVILKTENENTKISEYENLDCAISVARNIPNAIAIIEGKLIWEEN